MSQKEDILNHLRAFRIITPLYALRRYGCFRLAARISDLRREGHAIETKKHQDGYAIYIMAERG